MRVPLHSVRTGILTHLALLIVSALLLLNVVMVKFAERDLIQAKIDAGRLLICALNQKINQKLGNARQITPARCNEFGLEAEIEDLLKMGGFSNTAMINALGVTIFDNGPGGEESQNALAIARQALATKKWSVDFFGSTWGVIWLAHKTLRISAPIQTNKDVLGGLSVSASLLPVYQRLRISERMVLSYILLNAVLLILFGNYLLSRTVVRPIHQLLQKADEFKEGESFPSIPDTSRNEIGKIYRSLNLMISRLQENKAELKAHISSLEAANQELKKAQNEIARSEKLASVGRLATGLAHEIGNPIGIVLGYLDLVKSGEVSAEERQDYLNRIESEINRISRIIRDILDFSRHSNDEKTPSAIHQLLSETLSLIKPQPSMTNISIHQALRATNDKVWANPNQLRQVFLNIILNASDAMSQEMLPKSTSSTHILRVESENRANSIVLYFEDTGPGIPQKDLIQIFDPFYTTKDPGKGTGLGLSVCHRILEDAGGAIQAKSSPGRGTTIIVTLPLHTVSNEALQERVHVSATCPRG